MIKLLVYVIPVLLGFVYFYALSHRSTGTWWQDILAILMTVAVYSLLIITFYEDDRIGNLVFIVSTAVLMLFCYRGIANVLRKLRQR